MSKDDTWDPLRGADGQPAGPPTTPFAVPIRLVILLPVFDDWESARWLVHRLDDVFQGQGIRGEILLLDDCSPAPAPGDFVKGELRNLFRVESLRLRRNLGHQRAIAIGLSFIHTERTCDAVLVMDADGEDRPEDVPLLVRHFRETGGSKLVFARRMRRSEKLSFQLCYLLYRIGHRLLTGISVQVGNFSVLSASHLETLVVVSDTWNHYAASVFKSRIPHASIPLARGKRIAGESKMGFLALVLHGLTAISVFAEIVGVRLTLAIVMAVVVLLSLLVFGPLVAWATGSSIPPWAAVCAGVLLVVVLQMLTVALGLTLLVLFNRNNLSFLPIRDFRFFIARLQTLYERLD